MEKQSIILKDIKKEINKIAIQIKKIETLAGTFGVKIVKQKEQIMEALNSINIDLTSVIFPENEPKRYRKISCKQEYNKHVGEFVSGKHEFFQISYNKLISLFGTPLYKIHGSQFVWAFVSPRGYMFRIYDRSIVNGKKSMTKNELQNSDEIMWEISADWKTNVYGFIDWLQTKLGD